MSVGGSWISLSGAGGASGAVSGGGAPPGTALGSGLGWALACGALEKLRPINMLKV